VTRRYDDSVRTESWSRRAGRQGRGGLRRRAAGASPSLVAQAQTNTKRLEERFLLRAAGSERIVTLRAEMHQIMEESAAIYRTETVLKEAAGKLKRLQERVQDLSLDDNSYTFNTELTAASSSPTCWMWARPSSSPPSSEGSRAARTSAPTIRSGRRAVLRTPWPIARRMVLRIEYFGRFTITRWPRPARLREVARMPSTVALTVTRYRPEEESEPTFQTYEVPFRRTG